MRNCDESAFIILHIKPKICTTEAGKISNMDYEMHTVTNVKYGVMAHAEGN